MNVGPVCEAAKTLGHAFPGPRWWLTLTAADQGAWASGLGAFAAAFAAVGVVWYGNFREDRLKRARARLVAAYLYMPMTQVFAALKVIETHGQAFAGVMAGGASDQVRPNAVMLESACTKTRPVLNIFNIADAAYLPRDIGERLATGIMEAAFLFDTTEGSVRSYLAADEIENEAAAQEHRFDVAHGCNDVPFMAVHAREKIETFITFCQAQFGTTHH